MTMVWEDDPVDFLPFSVGVLMTWNAHNKYNWMEKGSNNKDILRIVLAINDLKLTNFWEVDPVAFIMFSSGAVACGFLWLGELTGGCKYCVCGSLFSKYNINNKIS